MAVARGIERLDAYAPLLRPSNRCHFGDRWMAIEGRLDLTEFDPIAPSPHHPVAQTGEGVDAQHHGRTAGCEFVFPASWQVAAVQMDPALLDMRASASDRRRAVFRSRLRDLAIC